jgi:signal transduction histidine kinase
MNLLNNAIKFTKDEGSVKLIVKNFDKCNLVYVSVLDSGIGICPQEMEKIGKPF